MMDVDMHNSRTLHYSLKDYQSTRCEDDLQFLSREERECILFFEETIGSLEEEEEEREKPVQREREREREFGAVQRSDSLPLNSRLARPSCPEDHDIIDLVHPESNTHTPTVSYSTDVPNVLEAVVAPENHIEIQPKHEQLSESAARAPVTTPTVTPTMIPANLATPPPQRRLSLDSPQMPKPGPPTHAKPSRLPENISALLGSREHIPHTLATEAASFHERRAQALAGLSGSAHPLDGGEPRCVRNLPTRSVSFHDPTPDKTRMEALSKLGLVQQRSQTLVRPPASRADQTDGPSVSPTLTSAEVTHSDFNSYGGKSITLNPSLSFRAEFVPARPEAPEGHHNSAGDSSQRVASPSHNDLPNHPKAQTSGRVPTPAPRQPRHASTPNPTRSHTSPAALELRHKPSKPSFRTQGITVQFSGRGATDEARRDALRKLGLLKDTS